MVKRSVAVTRGSLSHLIVPQSKTCVSTAAGVTKRRPVSLDMPAPLVVSRIDVEILEIPYLLGNGALSGQPLNARGAKESANAFGPAEESDRHDKAPESRGGWRWLPPGWLECGQPIDRELGLSWRRLSL